MDDEGESSCMLTNDSAISFRLVIAPGTEPSVRHRRELIPGRGDVYLPGFTRFRSFQLLEGRTAAVDPLTVNSYDGKPHEIAFPEGVSVVRAGENPEYDETTARIRYKSLVTPPRAYDYDVNSRTLEHCKTAVVPSGYERSEYGTERLFAPTHDGRSAPVSILSRTDRPSDGHALRPPQPVVAD
ncbi:MAG: hypothetical protein ACOCU9_04320 [Spirochaetota bacterium]